MPSHRMHRGLVALSASAVAAVYMAGYLRTQSADASIEAAAAATPAPIAVAAVAPATTTPAPQVQTGNGRLPPIVQPPTVPTAQPTPVPAAPPGSRIVTGTTPAGAYKDGTYTGQGSSRRGDVWVSVQVQGGKIAQVTITRSTLQYPLRDIAGLPNQVVQRQNAQVDIVSRATYSSQAFRTAVSQALSKAA
jgi:uncharacterized protein with FMN-binding domain